jgi:crossover junction endodeoxyribonuclease RuvC
LAEFLEIRDGIKILGIDPGLQVTGYGLIEGKNGKPFHILHGEIKGRKDHKLSESLFQIYQELVTLIQDQKPHTLVIEDVFYGKNIKSLIKQAQVRGVAILAGSSEGLPVFEYSPLEVKSAVVGYGRADKHQVQKMVQAILNLKEMAPPDASDALAIAVCHLHSRKETSL